MEKQLSEKLPRVEVVDALRGFAVMAILFYRFLWRLLLLVAFATLNAAFFPAGDVLLLFSVVGIVLFVVRKWSDCAILVTAILFLLQPVEWYHYIVGLFDPSYTLPDWGVGAMYKEVAEYTKEGSLWVRI